jgi:hypothetical protein
VKRRQRELLNALTEAAPGDPATQCRLIYVHANRVGASESDVKAVLALIIGGPVRECQR